jgi:hypothetical protein
MQDPRGLRIVALVAAAAVTAAVSARAASTAPSRTHEGSSVVDSTYSCQVRAQHYIDLDTTVTLPPAQKQPRPAMLNLFTVEKIIKRNGLDFNVPQLLFEAVKNSLRVDRESCRRSSRRIPLEPTGLAPGAQTVTPTYLGSLDERCVTTKRVLLRFRITTQSGVPAQALVAIRNDTRTRRAVEFVNWKPRKIKGYFAKRCVSTGTG